MKTWSRAAIDHLCGRCSHHIAVGEPMLTFSTSEWRKIRCERPACAGEPPPEDLPDVVVQAPIKPFLQIGRNRPDELPLDYKVRQAGQE